MCFLSHRNGAVIARSNLLLFDFTGDNVGLRKLYPATELVTIGHYHRPPSNTVCWFVIVEIVF